MALNRQDNGGIDTLLEDSEGDTFNELEQLVVDELEAQGVTEPMAVANVLGQIEAESNWNPRSEEPSKYATPDNNNIEGGWDYRGRGLIQLTHKSQYEKYGDMLGIDLVNNPDLANEPKIAAQIAALYMANKAEERGADLTDPYQATRLVAPKNWESQVGKRAKLAEKYLSKKKESDFDESAFQEWYSGYAEKLNLNPNPDDPRHYYDYRAAYKAGAVPNSEGHWPSKYKLEGHPRTVVDGINTITGKPVAGKANRDYTEGTSKDFADQYYDIVSDPNYTNLSVSEKTQALASLYNSRKWDEDTFDVVKQSSDFILSSASPEEMPDIPAIVIDLAGPPPTIEDGDTDPEKTMADWQESVYSAMWENKINPAYFGTYLDKFLKQTSTVELSAYDTRRRGILGAGLHWIGETIRGVARGAIRGYSDPLAGGVRLVGGTGFANALAEVPDTLGKPSQDYLYETDANGYLVVDKLGRPIPKVQSTIAEGIGQIGSFILGGAALKYMGLGAKAIMASMGGVNTLASMEQGYNEAKAEGATEEQAYNAGLLSMPIGAVTSLGSYAVAAGKLGIPPAIQGFTRFNQAKILAPYLLKNAAVEGATNAAQQLGQSTAVSQVLGKNVVTAEKVITAGAIGALGAGVTKLGEAYLAPTIPAPETPPGARPSTQAAGQEVQGLPAPEERLGLPAPEENVAIAGPEQRKALGGYTYTEGAEAPVRSYEPLSPEEQIGIGQKLDAFQKSDADVLSLSTEQATAVTPEMLNVLHMTAEPAENGVVLRKTTTHVPVDGESTAEINNQIANLQKQLENTPSPEAIPELLKRRAAVKQQYKTQADAYGKTMTAVVKERSKLQSILENKKAQYEAETDRTLKQIAKQELIEAEDNIQVFDDANENVYNAWQKLAPLEEELSNLNRTIKSALDPSRPYINDIAAIQKNIKGLVQKRKQLAVKAREEQARAVGEEQEAVKAAKRGVLAELGVEDTTIPDLSLGVEVEGFKVIPYNNKWYVVDANGEPLGKGHEFFYDAAHTIKEHEGVLYSQKTGRPEFVIKERIAERTALSEEASRRISETVAREKENKELTNAIAKELYEKEYQKSVKAAQERVRKEEVARKKAAMKGTPKTGKRGKRGKRNVEAATSEPVEGVMARATEESVAAESTKKPAEQSRARVVPVTELSKHRVIYSKPKRPLTSNYTKETKFARDGTKIVRPREVFKAAQELTKSLADASRILVGGAVPKNMLGYLNFVKNYIKVGRHDDITSVLHEMTHAVDRALIGQWDIKGKGDYSKLPQEVRTAAQDMYDMYYGRTGDPEYVKIAEGLALFFQHYASGQPYRKELGNWYKTVFAAEQPQVFKAMEGLKGMVHEYQNQKALNVVSGRIEEPESTLKAKTKRLTLAEYYRNWHDRWQPIKDTSERAYWNWVGNYKRANGVIANAIHGEPSDLAGNKMHIPNLKSALAPAAGKHLELSAYLVAKRALATAKAGIEPGIPTTEAAEAVRQVEAEHPDVALAARNYYQWQTEVIHPLLKQASERTAYLVDKIQAENLKTTGTLHGYYVPFKRVGHSTVKSFLRRTGSTKSVVDPLTEIQSTYTDLLNGALRQQTLEMLMHMAGSEGGVNNTGAMIREIAPGSKRIGLEKQLKERANAGRMEGEPEAGAEAEYMSALFDPEYPGVSGSDFRTFVIMDKNRPRFFEVDPSLVKAMDDRFADFVNNPFYKILARYPASVLRPMATAFRLPFQVVQLLRDPINAWKLIESEGLGVTDLVGLYKDTFAAIGDQILYHSGKKQGSWFGLADRLGIANFSQIGAENLLARQAKGTAKHKAIDISNITMTKLEQILSMPELGVRTAALKRRAKQLGISDPDSRPLTQDEALELALTFRESSTNFTRQGAAARNYNTGIPFFSARIAELTRIPADIKRQPWKMAAYAGGMLTAGVWYALSHQDADWYQELEPDAKAQRIWMNLNVGGVDKLVYYPLDSIGSSFWAVGQAIGTAMGKTDERTPTLVEFAKSILKTHAPISSWQEATGVGLKEAISQVANKDFYFNRSIVPPSLQYQDPRLQYSDSTTELAKSVGMSTGISPLRIDHAIRAAAPALADYLQFTDKVLGYKKGKENQGINFFSGVLSRSGSAANVMDRSQRLFTEHLIAARNNRVVESPEEGQIRKKLEKLNRTISDYNTVIYGIDDQKLKDELRSHKRDLLKLGLELVSGTSKRVVGASPLKNKAKAIRTQQSAQRKEVFQKKKESLLSGGALSGDTL